MTQTTSKPEVARKYTIDDIVSNEEYLFHVRRLVGEYVVSMSLLMDTKRFVLERVIRDHIPGEIFRGILAIATQEEEVHKYPADWWHMFKARFFPTWLKRKSPIRYNYVWAIHKFPELNLPNSLVGREFVHFKVIDSDELEKLGREKLE